MPSISYRIFLQIWWTSSLQSTTRFCPRAHGDEPRGFGVFLSAAAPGVTAAGDVTKEWRNWRRGPDRYRSITGSEQSRLREGLLPRGFGSFAGKGDECPYGCVFMIASQSGPRYGASRNFLSGAASPRNLRKRKYYEKPCEARRRAVLRKQAAIRKARFTEGSRS
jgi:hypothetical protein